MKRKNQKGIVMVEWVDSYACYGWRDKDEKAHVSRICSAGIVEHSTPQELVLIQSRSSYNNAGLIAIPRKAITRIRRLKV